MDRNQFFMVSLLLLLFAKTLITLTSFKKMGAVKLRALSGRKITAEDIHHRLKAQINTVSIKGASTVIMNNARMVSS
jgi:hypothetical protein